MKILVIHNFDSHERFESLMNEFKNQNIRDFKFIDAVHDVHSAKRGINQAHKNCIRYAKSHLLDEVCIMEDDVAFTKNDSFQYFLGKKPLDFDIYLSGIYLGDIDEDNRVKDFCGLHCYIVKSKFFDKFLSANDDEHIDRALANLGDYHVCNPFAAIQYNGFSYNTKMDMNYDDLLKNRELY